MNLLPDCREKGILVNERVEQNVVELLHVIEKMVGEVLEGVELVFALVNASWRDELT